MPTCLAVTAEGESICPSSSLNMSDADLVQCEIDDSLFFLAASDAEELSGSVTDPGLLPSSSSCNARLRADEELMTNAINELGLEWSPLRSHLATGCTSVFSRGAFKPPANARPPSTEVHMSSQYCGTPPTRLVSVLLLQLFSNLLTALKKKGYEHLPPLNKSVAAHLCPPTAMGWKARVSQPSKPCRATSALAGRAYSAVGQVASALHSMAVL